ncbi:MAG: hypothetical protein ACRED3_12770 [Bradyrhizobium sp.]
MNMPIAETKDMELNAFTDKELDDVNGGFLPLIFLASAGFSFVGTLAGITIGRAINRISGS